MRSDGTLFANSLLIADPSVGSINVGDEIIRQAALTELATMFPERRLLAVPTQTPLGPRGRRLLDGVGAALVTGTNILGLERWRTRSWRIGLGDLAAARGRYLSFGCGAFSYRATASRVSRRFLTHLLARGPHAVRDENTAEFLRSIGFESVFTTGCPTLWRLDQTRMDDAWRRGPTREVVFAFNSNKQSERSLGRTLEVLDRVYERVHVWNQRPVDVLPGSVTSERRRVIPPRLVELDRALEGRDYVGARLHAGVRALSAGSRAMIIAVDNRAAEMGRTSALPVAEDDDALPERIESFATGVPEAPRLRLGEEVRREYTAALRDYLSGVARRYARAE